MPAPRLCVILGGGGHCRVLLDILLDDPLTRVAGILDGDPARRGGDVWGVPILGDDGRLAEMVAGGVTHFVVGLGSVGNADLRARLFALGRASGLTPLDVVHPAAVGSRRIASGLGVQRLAGSVVNAGAVIGDNVIVNTGAVVEHDCRLADHVHVASGARLAGNVRVGYGAHVGAGATVLQGVSVGDRAVVGAGAVVVRDVPPGIVVVGVPAKPLKAAGAAATGG